MSRIENHLLDCGSCRVLVAKLRSGHRFASQLPRAVSQRDGWRALEAAIDAEPSRATRGESFRTGTRITIKPSIAVAVVAVTVILFGLLLVLKLRSPVERDGMLAFEAIDFHRVSIAGIERNTEPHVVAEGYVSEVRIDHEDGDLVFKLVDDVQQQGPFIVCEILNPRKLAPPRVGSRVRVYGVSRYDNQENHNWYEVHPVLNIEEVRR